MPKCSPDGILISSQRWALSQEDSCTGTYGCKSAQGGSL